MTAQKTPPASLPGFITVTSPQNRTVYIRADAITGIIADSEGSAGILTDAHNYDAMESQAEVVDRIKAVSRTTTPAPTEIRAHKQDREPDPKKKTEQKQDHAWPPPPDDMREGDLPKDPNHDPKADTWQRDRSDADAAKSQD